MEGCGSARRAVDPVAVLRVWVEAPDDLRLERGLARDGADAREHWLAWMADEAAHFARERTRERADVRLDAFGDLRTRRRGVLERGNPDRGGRVVRQDVRVSQSEPLESPDAAGRRAPVVVPARVWFSRAGARRRARPARRLPHRALARG